MGRRTANGRGGTGSLKRKDYERRLRKLQSKYRFKSIPEKY